MRCQSGIVIGFLDQILRPSPLVIEPHQQIQGPVHVGHERAIDILRSVEELILLALFGTVLLLLVAQGDKAVCLTPTLRLVAEFALLVSIGLGPGLPVGGLQLFQQTRGLAGHDDEVRLGFLVGLHGLPAIETGIGPREDRLDAFGQGGADTLQMPCDLFSIGPIAITQFSPNVFVGFGQKGEGLIAFLAFVFGLYLGKGTMFSTHEDFEFIYQLLTGPNSPSGSPLWAKYRAAGNAAI
jgi:hypothetical protein